jgi:hypothetical protein
LNDSDDEYKSLGVTKQTIQPARIEMRNYSSSGLGAKRVTQEGGRFIIVKRFEVKLKRFDIILLADSLNGCCTPPIRYTTGQHKAGISKLAQFTKYVINRISFPLSTHFIERINHQNGRIAKQCSRVIPIDELAGGTASVTGIVSKPAKQIGLSHTGFAQNN